MNINETMRELAEYMRLSEEITATVESLKDSLKAYMAEQGVDTIAGTEHKASYRPVTNSRIDTTELKKQHPDIATQYTKTSETKRFLFT